MRYYIAIALDHCSQAWLASLAIYPVVRGNHVTLAYPKNQIINASLSQALEVFPDYDPAWLMGWQIGDFVELSVIGWAANDRVQAAKVELKHSSLRPWDQGILHITISRRPGVESSESNQLLATNPTLTPLDHQLTGTIQWCQTGQ